MRRCRFYLLADLVSWRLLQQMMEDINLTHLIWSLRDCSGEDEKMQILSVSCFSVLDTSTADDGGHWFNSFDFMSKRRFKKKMRRCRFYLLADLMSWRLPQLMKVDTDLTYLFQSPKDCWGRKREVADLSATWFYLLWDFYDRWLTKLI